MPVELNSCCGFVRDLRNAAVLIVLLAIITNPLVSWILVRHTYAIQASCLLSFDKDRSDTLSVNAENFLNIGFGGTGASGASCLHPIPAELNITTPAPAPPGTMVEIATYLGWAVTAADLVFLVASLYFLTSIFSESARTAAGIFMWTCAVTVLFSFIYCMIYIHVCITIGKAFPLFEFVFGLLDFLLWLYFILVIMSYRNES